MEQKEPLKKIPSTHANAISRSAKHSAESIHFIAHCALRFTVGMLWIAFSKCLADIARLVRV
jgi:hypothetical protein